MASGKKRQLVDLYNSESSDDEEYTFKVLLPNGASVDLTLKNLISKMQTDEFIRLIRDEHRRVVRRSDPSVKEKRQVKWDSSILTDAEGVDFGSVITFKSFKPQKCHILRIHEGDNDSRAQHPEPVSEGFGESDGIFENMWDLTPDADILKVLPEEYTFRTALADLIDNSLQAVWSNEDNDRKLISVIVSKDKICIFDTGPGMDGSTEYSIENWGRFGASLHRPFKEQAIGGKPPYLKPFFGMFGYGGPIASMHLGRSARVSSKRKSSKKVYILHLEREALLKNSGSKEKWKTNGGIRDPRKVEFESAPHGSFTKVEIFEPKLKNLDIGQIEYWLKDIYFPYIQCDEISKTGKTITPVEFEVNGKNLSETQGGEVAITNLHSSDGPHFVLQVHFSLKPDNETKCSRSSQEANARLKCVYFPVLKGKESIDMILEMRKGNKHNVTETYEDFSRVSVRRLGRLLPDARWKWLPFMDLRRKKGKRTSHILKICCSRVKCFIDTDAGINPSLSKTDVAHGSPFTVALKNFGNNLLENDKGLDVKVYRDGRLLSPLQLDNEYQDWIIQMHSLYDEEAHCGEDEPLVFVSPQKVKGQKEKGLDISSDVARFHKIIKWKGKTWKSGQNVKILKGACAGVHKKNVYATIEYFLVEGLEGDPGGATKIICRPIDVPEDEGFYLDVKSVSSYKMRKSIWVPISIIDSEKLIPVESIEWSKQEEKELLKFYSGIELLSADHCQELEVDSEELYSTVEAGKTPPKELVAVVRPANFGSAQKDLDQKDVFKCNVEMSLKVEFEGRNDPGKVKHVYAKRVASSQRKGINGIYVFSLGSKLELFRKSGTYTFTFSLIDGSCEACVQRVKVNASPQVKKWKLQSKNQSLNSARVGFLFGPLSIECYDSCENCTIFPSRPKVQVKLNVREDVLHVKDFKTEITPDKSLFRIKDILIESSNLDKIKPAYKATLVISSSDGSFSVNIPLCVYPGEVVRAELSIYDDKLFPDCIVKQLKFQMFDAYGNHAMKDSEVQINLNGFQILDHLGIKRKVDGDGCIDLSGILRVTAGYGEKVSLSVEAQSKVLSRPDFQIESRELRIASMVPDLLTPGSKLEDLTFEIVSLSGDVDETIHHDENNGFSHMLTIKADWLNIEDTVRYMFKHGRCTVPPIPLPQDCGNFLLEAFHSRHLTLRQTVEVGQSVLKLYLEKPALQILPPDYGELESPCSSGKSLFLQDSSSPLKQVGKKFLMNVHSNIKKLEDEMDKMDSKIKELKSKRDMLNEHKAEAEQNIRELQGPRELCLVGPSNQFFRKEEVIEEIERNCHSAASVLCSISRSQESINPLVRDVIGVVALLCSVDSFQLSRVLSEYLGDDLMLAVVSRSFEAASDLEKYRESGAVDCNNALHAEALRLGKTLNNRYLVICLEDISPFRGLLDESCPQRKLAIPNPATFSGAEPPGFLGFAVNMIVLGKDERSVKTSLGHGLRETLFYRLFGNLQVYMTREEMLASRACITHGAVSLDGGILKENGIVALGSGDPTICFLVVPSSETPSSQANTRKLEHWRSELKRANEVLGNLSKELKRSMKKFDKAKEECDKLIKDVSPLLEPKKQLI